MRKKGMVWFTLLLLLVSFIPSLIQAYVVYAQSPDEVSETIVKNDQLDVSTLVKQVDDQMLWEIKYQLNSPAPNIKQRLKFKIYQGELVETNLAAPENIEGWGYGNDNWFMPENFSQTTQGSIFVKTDLSVEQLVLKLQIDEEVTTETILATMAEDSEEPAPQETVEEVVVTENVLEAPISNPHQLSAPTVKVQVTQTPESAPMIEESADTQTENEESENPVNEGGNKITVTSSENDTSSEESSESTSTENESSPSESEDTESTELDFPTSFSNPYASRMSAFPAVAPSLLSVETSNGFDYTTNDYGRFPTHGTDPIGNSDDTVNNFDFGTQVSPGTVPQVENILSGDLTFEGGYHSYDLTNFPTNALLKKTVKPTADLTEFEITLDVIGATNRTVNKIDVVFVIDKSGSMKDNNRWSTLKTELAKFSKALIESSFEPGNIQMGLVAFDDLQTSNPTRYTSRVRIADFANGNSTTNITGFTADYNRFDATHSIGHNLLKNDDPNGGTPLFLGIDAGIELLSNTNFGARADARKVLIVLSDGVATYAPTQNYLNNGLNSLSKTKPNNTIQYLTNTTGGTWPNQTNTHVIGDGQETDINLLAPGPGNQNQSRRNVINLTNQFITNRKSSSYLPISIGLGLTGTYSSQAKGILRNFAGGSITDPTDKGNFFDAAVDDLDDALDKVRTLILTLHDMIRDGIVTDPMSQYVDLIGGTVKTYALLLDTITHTLTSIATTNPAAPQYAKDAVVDQTLNPLTITNLYLGGVDDVRHGYRMTYKVKLKEEYQDGLFYPANGRTTLEATNIDNPLDFAIPSVRHQSKFNIPVTKEWVDDNNTWSTRQSITLQLQKRVGTGSTWQNVTGKSVVLPVGTTSYTFTDIPAYESGTKIDYRIQETPTRVQGYKAPVYTPASVNVSTTGNKTLKVTNELLKTKVEFTKVKSDGTTPLVGVGFTLYKADGTTPIGSQVLSDTTGKVSFPTQIPIGSYVVKETLTPLGYEPVADMNLTVTDTNAVLSVNGLPTGNKVVNHLKDFKLVLTKLDNHGNAVNGAKFLLTSTTTSPPYSQELTSTTNVFEFTGLKPGTYTLTETATPDGFIGIENPITIVIDIDGNVTIDGSVQNGVITANGNIITLDVINRQKGQLPSTGGQGTNQFMWTTVLLITLARVVSVYYVYRNKKGAKVK